jgi:hypothetical protein
MSRTTLQSSAFILLAVSLNYFGHVALAYCQQNEALETTSPTSPSTTPIDPFKGNNETQPARNVDPSLNDPFDRTLGEVAKTLKDPIPFASLPAEELVKMEENIRSMRISVLNRAIEVVRTELQTGSDRVGLMREYAELIEEVTTLEIQRATSSVGRRAAIQRAIDAWRHEEKNASDVPDGTRSALAIYFGSRYRLRWEQAMVKELRETAAVKSSKTSVVQSTPIQSTNTATQNVYYPSVQQPSQRYYYPRQQTYPYSRSYRSR